ncbi:MAG: type II secretion system protein GspK [Kiritimatiellae bacterium]|nr:type II secretion system protein GspK [Kiritimatiellia bacterium]
MKRDGSILVVALVAVSVVTMLALALGSWVCSQNGLLAANHDRRASRNAAANAANWCVAELLAADTNGWDAGSETWGREPWERREEQWIMRVSGRGWSPAPGETSGLLDEAGKVPLNAAGAAWLAVLLQECAIVPAETAAGLAARVVDWRDDDDLAGNGKLTEEAAYGTRDRPWASPNRPFACVEELADVPGMTAEIVEPILPLVTVAGAGTVNLNTASEAVLRALFASCAAGDERAAPALLERVLLFRRAGKVFMANGAKSLGRDLGGLPAGEAALLARAEPLLGVSSTAFSGIVEVTTVNAETAGRRAMRALFVWDRKRGVFARWVEE